jgi:aspartyl-tRNA synthetase
LYTPKNFVCHTHKYESNTRHWGFDSSNWRIYLKLANSSTLDTKSTTTTTATTNNGNVLNDIKISNKDNIAANSIKSNNVQNLVNEEFEHFKKKFLNTNGHLASPITTTTATTATTTNELLKRKSFCENDSKTINSKYEYSENNPNKRLLNNSSCSSLNDLNNHLINTNGGVVTNNNNTNSSNDLKLNLLSAHQAQVKQSSNSIGEHKLLNGLLSKPLNTQNSETG